MGEGLHRLVRHAGLAQLAEHFTCNEDAVGSSPTPGSLLAKSVLVLVMSFAACACTTADNESASQPSDTTARVRLPDGSSVAVDGDDHVTVYDRQGRVAGESWCGANGFEYVRTVRLFRNLQDALRRDDRVAIVRLVDVPLNWNHGARKDVLDNRVDVRTSFTRIFTPEVVANIEQHDARAMFCRSSGIMLGDGVIWGGTDGAGRYVVHTINA